MKISIIIPIYNAENTIDKCIESLVNQTERDIEVILVDDKSSDNTVKKLSCWSKQDERIKAFYNEQNIGTFMTRKRGVMEARGEYIMFADNDDWYELNACKELYNLIKNKETDILIYGARGVKISDAISDEQISDYNKHVTPIEEHYVGDNCVLADNKPDRVWNKIIRATICKKAYSSSEDIKLTHAEDTYAAWLIASYAKSMTAIADVYYNHSMGTGITTSYMTVQNFDNWCHYRKLCEEAIGRHINRSGMSSDVLDYFEICKKSWATYCLNAFYNKVPIENKVKALEILLQYYGLERIDDAIGRDRKKIQALQANVKRYRKLCDTTTDYRKKYKTAVKENKRLTEKINAMKNSKSWKLTRIFRRRRKWAK